MLLINEAQAEDLLRQDAVIAERAVLRLISVPLTDGQFDALVWAGGRRLKDLVRRREADINLYQKEFLMGNITDSI